MNTPNIPSHIEVKIKHNSVRQMQYWTASGVSAILCIHGCLVDSLWIAGSGMTAFFIAGMTAIAHRVGNDHIFAELRRQEH